ncbi:MULTISPECIES: hypothetical protein [unclassified Cupriavidus]|uniref:hypothetical protein n=1 Tax=unclassified Cupriavidus TaxID=2640874 RepID=UPI0010F6DF1C|nr:MULTISPECIES: hypothetical protein [unclassified Cupriavidus]MWL90718.1 hypothetical protein [Cupriavidus sp. SW-Y-13]
MGQLRAPKTLPAELDALPVEHVSEYVLEFARAHHIEFSRSGVDDWSEAVTRAAGDDVALDATEKLLVTLKKQQLISGRQMARLMTNHMRERKHVRPVQ